MLDLSRVESAEFQLAMASVHIGPVINDVISMSEPMAKERNISIQNITKPEGSFFYIINFPVSSESQALVSKSPDPLISLDS